MKNRDAVLDKQVWKFAVLAILSLCAIATIMTFVPLAIMEVIK
mgnify:FL=1|jgi:hypothetical protein